MRFAPFACIALVLAAGACVEAVPSKDNGLATDSDAVSRRSDIMRNGMSEADMEQAAADAGESLSDADGSGDRRARRPRDHDIDVSLFWSSNSDMDLRVKEPGSGGCDVWYGNPECDHAFLVEDIIPSSCDDGETAQNEEKIVWPRYTGNPGKYKVTVSHYRFSCGPRTTMVRVDAKSRGRRIARKHFTIKRGKKKSFRFKRRDCTDCS